MKLEKELTALLQAGVIDPDTAQRIRDYYTTKAGSPQNRLIIVFGILGAILVGLGIILIMAHNWDDFSKGTKTGIAFLPLIVGHFLCGYALLRQKESTVWREASSAFLFISIGACVSLIGQIYNVPGELDAFLLTWMLLVLPLIYVMQSSVASLLYIAGITWYGCETGYWGPETESYLYWILLLLALPHYGMLVKKNASSNFVTMHNWFIPVSVVITLGTLAMEAEEIMVIAYMSLFGLLYQIGNLRALREEPVRNNGYLVLGSLGTVVMLLGLSFDFFWIELRESFLSENMWQSTEMLIAGLITLAALGMLAYIKKDQKPPEIKPADLVFILFIILFFVGMQSVLAPVLINVIILIMGVMTIREGARLYHFGILNYGLLIVTALVICRFFDTDLSFVIRGLLFVAVGAGFFLANYQMMKKKKALGISDVTSLPSSQPNTHNEQ